MSFLDNLPLGSIIAIAGILVTIYAYVTGDINYDQAMLGVGLSGGSGGAIGVARAMSGKGIK